MIAFRWVAQWLLPLGELHIVDLTIGRIEINENK